MVDLTKIKARADWRAKRVEIDATVREVLGELPMTRVDPQFKVLDETSYAGYSRRRINYFVDDWERVSAWMFVPDGRDEVPAILCCHQAVPQGKDEPAGISGNPRLAFAQHYAELGYITIAPDVVTAGERKPLGLPQYDTKSFYKDNPQMSALGKMLQDHSRALDALEEVKRVDMARIGVIGHGLGGLNALLLAAFDERVQCCVSSCGFSRICDEKSAGPLTAENGVTSLPKLRGLASKDFPFDFEHILSLAAPSPLLVLTALNDEEVPNAKGCEKSIKVAQDIYKMLGAKGALLQVAHKEGHTLNEDLQQQADDWLERWL